MKIEFDPDKNDKNIRERSLSFERAEKFDFLTAQFVVDDRVDYGETRIRALGFVEQRLHALVFVETTKVFGSLALEKQINVR